MHRSALLFILSLPLFTSCAQADTAAAARALLAQAKQATGGAAWDQLTSTRRIYTNILDNGETDAGSELTDLQSGRYAATIATPNGLPLRFGWDGKRYWESQFGISNYKQASEADLAFIKCLGQWYARCGPGIFSMAGQRQHGGASYGVVRITSPAHKPVEFWINHATRRIERLAYGPGLRNMVDYADFRQVGAVQIAFEERTTSPTGTLLMRLSRVELNAAVPEQAWTKPVDRPIEGLAGHPDGVTVDLDKCGDQTHLCVHTMLNGKGPFRMMLDSGAALNVMTPETAARLGVKVQGKVTVQGTSNSTSAGALASVARTSLDSLTQAGQTFAVLPIGYEGADGLLGYQWLRQAVTRIDWAARKLTFYDPASYVYRGPAQPRPLEFVGNVPRVEARIDGHAGWFNLDTGDFAGVTVNPAFARATGLDVAYPNGEVSHYGGIGGGAQALLTQAKLLEFGNASLRGPQLQLSRQTRDLLSAPGLAGNLGYAVLHRFDIVLDYPGSRMYFEQNAQTPCGANCDKAAD
ncbi:retropepsin-like aspartic protease [Massilia sp. S19_KUP03_FR1]|uniref:retropepsin-like aspartic protease n=1 Tax=Massilia sp. S19_KUP03_FR1 TaxID=3025503 RepID=UPI002FCD55B5